jgi:tRNA pseudouridine32 synthase/23S rRNA pseudouridine746 synthase/23S rRNA pseudouridine1911/1915/1917 synthase
MEWTNTKVQPLLEALKEGFPDSSTNNLRSWIKDQRISVGKKVTSNTKYMVQPGQKISLGKRKLYMQEGIEILYEDDHMVALYKPAGILSVATDYDVLENVHTYLKKRFNRRKVYPVHRLDREASGVMVFAYSDAAQYQLKKQFEEHSILRQYIAIVEGDLQPTQSTWQSYLYEDGAYYVRSVSDPALGERAVTHYKVIKRYKNTSSLLVTLETGKKNQIRVHCKEAGHSILGDQKYGSTLELDGRIALHAYKLGLEHPILKKPMMFQRDAPPEFTKYLP